MFFADLSRKINVPHQVDFIQLSSYIGTESHDIKLKKNLDIDIKEKDVIIVEDIIDTGRSILFIDNLLKKKKPRSISFCTLLDKPSGRLLGYEKKIEHVGFTVANEFVIGYGLDYDEGYRHLPSIRKKV